MTNILIVEDDLVHRILNNRQFHRSAATGFISSILYVHDK